MTTSLISRRAFLKLMWAAALSQTWECVGRPAGLSRMPAVGANRLYQGADLTGWMLALGDATYASPGEPPVAIADVETTHHGDLSELQANTQGRGIMAHNITFLRRQDPLALDYIHRAGYSFRLPYLPVADDWDLNAQTLEGGFFIWDGSDARLDYGLAFQWVVNPWLPESGQIRCWTNISGGQWQAVGHLEPDMEWHTLTMTLDVRRQTTALIIDSSHYPCQFSATSKPADWGGTIDARLQAEIVSLYPGVEGRGALHNALFRDWSWAWEPYSSCHTYLPAVMR